MININLTDNVVVIEPDPNKLNVAVRTALDEAREVLRAHYLSEFDNIPPIEIRVSVGKKADNNKNGAHIIYHMLSPQPNVSLLASYVKFLDEILHRSSKDYIPIEIVSQMVIGSTDIIGRWTNSDHYKVVFRHALRAVFVSLLRQRAVLLPSNPDRYLPLQHGVWRGFDLMPERLKEIVAACYAGSDYAGQELDYGVDWKLCTYSFNGLSTKEHGIEQSPTKWVKARLVGVAMCTRWEHIDELDPSDIYVLQDLVNTMTIGFYLTYLYLKAPDKGIVASKVFPWVESIPFLRIYVEEYSLCADRAKKRRSTTKRRESGAEREEYLANNPDVDRRSLKERLHEVITEATKFGRVNPILLARSLGLMNGRTTLRPDDTWPQESVLPDSIPFDWVSQTAHWLGAFNLYARMTNYADMDQELNKFTPFIYYLTVYLPIYFQENPDSNASYPARIEALNGLHFISCPIEMPSLNLPIPYATFVREYYSSWSQERIYTALSKLYSFFTTILGRRELLGIPGNFENPVLTTDIPKTGGRPMKTVKTKLPRKVYWLALLYAYKIYDYVSVINQKCLDDKLYADRYSLLHRNLDKDEFGKIDIRDILSDDEADRVIIFEGVEYEANLVPAYFFFPVEIPLKGMGKRFVIRPHVITHLICTLETGIRNQHIQWLSYDFDKNIQFENIITEDVYRLFVMTDKSNKSWTAHVAGRVIKILREMRTFRDLIDSERFNDKLHYEGRKENGAYPPFKVLFAFNPQSGNPYSDNNYSHGFKGLMVGLQCALDYYGVEFNLFETVEGEDEVGIKDKISLVEYLSPHSLRVTVVGEFSQFLTSEYVGKYITNQKVCTVWYYTKYDADVLKKMQDDQKRGLSQFNRDNSEVRLIGNGGETIDATNPNSILAKAFKEDIGQAITDFGAVSSHFFDRESGIGILMSNRRLTLAFEPTHICPFNRICPADRHKIGYADRCNFCDYAIRCVEHLPALGCKRRDLLEELEDLESYANEKAAKLTEGQERDIDARLSIIAEDLGSLDLAEKILEENLRRLKEGEKGETMHVYTPEIIIKKLEAMPFPDMKDEFRYLLARLSEVNTYPDATRHVLMMKFLVMSNNIRANTGNTREMLRRGSNINRIEAQVFSLVNSIRNTYGLSLDEVAEIAGRDIEDVIQLDNQPTFLIPDAASPAVAAFNG